MRKVTKMSNANVQRYLDVIEHSGWLEQIKSTRRSHKRVLCIAADTFVVLLALWGAYSLRLGTLFQNLMGDSHLFIIMPPITIAIFTYFGIYRWVVRSSTSGMFLQIVKGSALASLSLLVLLYLLPPHQSMRSLFVIYGLLLISGACGWRLLWRRLFFIGERGKPVALYGAGLAGQQLASYLSESNQYCPTCFIDDDESLAGSLVHGLPVMSGGQSVVRLKSWLSERNVSEVVIAIPSLSDQDFQALLKRLEELEMPVRTLPRIAELLSGRMENHEIRDISIGDILGRREVAPVQALLGKCVVNKVVLVTGGGGSIGSEICRQILHLKPRKLLVLDSCEANLYHIMEELQAVQREQCDLAPVRLESRLCSVTDKVRIPALFETEAVDTVYHAAAYKHVPIVEKHPGQGVDINVFGTLNVVDAAIASRVKDFLFISTDKAVRPTSCMGASKRIAEMVLQAKAQTQQKTRISMVRFGNVLGSTGSVVPKFKRQIEEGGPVTLTHPDITRYFMTIPEASELVLQASAIAKGGDVFVLDMGDPMRIRDLAETMIGLYQQRAFSARQLSPDIDIQITGLRPGEKLFEELFIGENCRQTIVEKIWAADEQSLSWKHLERKLVELRITLGVADKTAVREHLLTLAARKAPRRKITRRMKETNVRERLAHSAVC